MDVGLTYVLAIITGCCAGFSALAWVIVSRADADLTLLLCEKIRPAKRFTDQVVWITGASSGIGECLAYQFAALGAKIALSGVNIERLEKVKQYCIVLSGHKTANFLSVPFLIEDFSVHDDCVQRVLEYFGHIDILVNNAGISQRADFETIDIEVDRKLFDINVFGTVNLTRKVLVHFFERNQGHIVVTSSMAGKLGAPYSSAYTGSKHALHGYFECLRSETHQKNIDITIICPGPVFSLITDRCVTDKLGKVYEHKQKPTDIKMKTQRCSELMVTAITNKLDECWICFQPLLTVFYLVQYMPSIFRRIILKKIFTKERVMEMRQGRK